MFVTILAIIVTLVIAFVVGIRAYCEFTLPYPDIDSGLLLSLCCVILLFVAAAIGDHILRVRNNDTPRQVVSEPIDCKNVNL